MAFNQTSLKRSVPVSSREGGVAYTVSAFDELYMLVATSLFLGDDTFYEKGSEGLDRFHVLTEKVLREDPGAYAALAAYARQKLNLRSTPSAMLGEMFLRGQGKRALELVSEVWLRGDEHLETMAYVDTFKSASYPNVFKRALAARLNSMTPRQFIKYASGNKSKSQYDALNVARPVPKDEAQAALFKYVVKGVKALTEHELSLNPALKHHREEQATTWENVISHEGSNTAAWEKSIPKMGYMALLRNLRNFVEKDVGDELLSYVAAKLSDEVEVLKSRQLPYRFLSAFRALPSHAPSSLKLAVSKALDLSVKNTPKFPGRSLVMVDMSGSMFNARVSERSEVMRTDVAATVASVFGLANDADVWVFSEDSEKINIVPGSPVLMLADRIISSSIAGSSTYTGAALERAFSRSSKPYDRVVIFTDGQPHDNPSAVIDEQLRRDPELSVYEVNIVGYESVSFSPRHLTISGFSASIFELLAAFDVTEPRKLITDWYSERLS